MPPVAAGSNPSRRLFARLRDVMAGSGTGQQRLDKIVQLIATEMVAEVCSCYVMRPGEVLELFATVGLNPSAVHKTRLRVSEGLVGEIAGTARPMAIADAPHHPKFAYRPETGEDPYQSLAGVPILRGGRVRGVLAIQNRRRRIYSDDEVETLQTIGMVIAELITGGELRGRDEAAQPTTGRGQLPVRLEGAALNPGLAQGLAVLHRPQLTIRQMVADDPAAELDRLRNAVEAMHSSIDDLVTDASVAALAETRDVLESYRMFAADRGWLGRIHEAIKSGLTAEAAVQRVHEQMTARMAHLTDPYLRERLLDLDDLATRLLMHLAGHGSVAGQAALPDEVVLVARSLGPAELLDYHRRGLKAVVLEDGSPTSHVAIIARALDIPVIGRCAGAMAAIDPLDRVVVDADNGQVFVQPSEDVQALVAGTLELRARQRREYADLALKPATSRDGVTVSLNINAGLLVDLAALQATGADGIGLFRTEIAFMVRPDYPDVAAQTELYSRVLDQAAGKPVVFRTLDAGGDKRLPFFEESEQENPALGWRAIRIGLDRPAMLRQQLRAMIRAAAGRPLTMMLPMVAEVDELDRARRLLELELERADQPPERLAFGVVVEVPSLLWQLPQLLARVDFVAVGSNDLAQYFFAADRGSPAMARRYDPLSPAMLAMLRRLVEACAEAGRPLSLCGEMAGRPLDAMALVGLGFRTLSMSPGSVGPVKAMLRSLEVGSLAVYLDRLVGGGDHSLRSKLTGFARDHGIRI